MASDLAVFADSDAETRLAALVNGEHRADGYAARNVYRHPLETLTFFRRLIGNLLQ